MYKLKCNRLYASEIANYLNTSFYGKDILIIKPVDINAKEDNVLCYYDGKSSDALSSISNEVLIIAEYSGNIGLGENITVIASKNPKRDFYKAVNEFFVQGKPHTIDKSAFVIPEAKIGYNVNIGKNSYIDSNVEIGNNTYIGNNVIISGTVSLGSNCIVKDGAVIGSEGFAFIEDPEGIIHIPQFGEIKIGNDVWIGTNTTIERPVFGKTYIDNAVKIDDLVHIGQGVSIGAESQITAGVVLATNVKVGCKCFLGINSSVKDMVQIGDNAVIGMGSAVISDVSSNQTYMGVPAKQKGTK